jgi:hypothetical protein
MPNFRCHFRDERGCPVFVKDIDVEDLDAAKHHGFNILCAENPLRSIEVRGLEIWQGDRRVYPVSDLLTSLPCTYR